MTVSKLSEICRILQAFQKMMTCTGGMHGGFKLNLHNGIWPWLNRKELRSLCSDISVSKNKKSSVNFKVQTTYSGTKWFYKLTPDGYILGLSGRPSYIDVTITHPTGATHMRNGSTRHKHFALKHLEDLKITKFEQRYNDYVPLALETYGGTSEKFDKLIENLRKQLSSIIFHIQFYSITGRKGSLLFYKLVMFLLFLKLIVVSLILEQTDYSVIMIWNELLISL